MVRQYKIETLEDIIQLDSRQRIAFIKDLIEWLKFMDGVTETSSLGVKVKSKGMIWKDDGIVGLSGINVDFASDIKGVKNE